MRRIAWFLGGSVATLAAIGLGSVTYVRSTGLDSRSQPSAFEARLARIARSLSIAGDMKGMRNPVTPDSAVLEEAMGHFADHCASCHANDGSGNTDLGRGLFPKAPDMRLAATQNMTDGELFYVIEHGIRFTGMPAWSTGTKAGEESTWQLVHFIRHLPQLSASELDKMQQLNPRSPEEVRQEIEEERFLNEGAR
jgi:mono/diheme cytochrome c family protein